MAELLIRVVDKTDPDPVRDQQFSKAGDVIVVAPDGHGWSATERSNPDWIIVKLPGVDPSALSDLLDPDVDGERRMLRRRGRQIDLTAPAVANQLAGLGASNRVVAFDTPGKRAAFLAARKTKPPVANRVRLG